MIEDICTTYSGVDRQGKLRNFIIDAYNNWETLFVFLGGDNNDVLLGGLKTSGILMKQWFCLGEPSRTPTR